MTIALMTALLGFALVTTITPGPNNLMLMASGARFGFRRTLPHMFGIAGGMVLLTVLCGMGLVALLDAVPVLRTVLEVLSVGYLLWLAWKIAMAGPAEDRQTGGRPMSFLGAAAFQWVNLKAWAMCLSAVTLYAPDRTLVSVAVVAAAFALICLPAISIWVWLGTVIRQWLGTATRLRLFNVTMAVLLVATLIPALVLAG